MFWMTKLEEGCLSDFRNRRRKKGTPNLVVASLGANRKDRPNGEVTARVLHDGTNGLAVNTRTRLRGPGAFTYLRGPQKSNAGEGQAGLQHICSYGRCERSTPPDPYRPEGLALAWLPIGTRRRCLHEHRGDIRHILSVHTTGPRVAGAIGRLTQYVAASSADTWHMGSGGRLPPGRMRSTVPACLVDVFCALPHSGSPAIVTQD